MHKSRKSFRLHFLKTNQQFYKGKIMTNILIIVAHPKEEGFSFAMANTYKENREAKGDTVEMLDLYREAHQQPFFTYEDANTLTSTESMKYYQDKISKADEIALVFPYWWGSFPAILKNFFDWNLSKGFAFHYVNSRPKGLLTGKTVRVFTTTGTPKFVYTLTGANRRLKNMIKEQIVQFCGMKLDGCHIYGGLDTSGEKTEKILEEIKAL
jgi:NAD(P)H dehydrogenase (quinone)